MFNFQGSELVIILLLALVVLGPEKLPDAMRRAGKAYSELRRASSSFQEEFRAVVDEPMREMRETADVIRDSADFNSLADGSRDEKPKSADMAAVATPGTADDEQPDAPPTEPRPGEEPGGHEAPDDGPAAAPTAQRGPFRGENTLAPAAAVERVEPDERPGAAAPPPRFTPSGDVVDGDDDATPDEAERHE